jgi:type IV secretory pathway TrbL component
VNDAILNRITGVFAVTVDGAYAALSVYSIGLLSVLGLIYMMVTLGQVLSGGSPPALGLATMLWTAIKVGIFVWLMTVLYDLMWNGAFMTFLQWGLTASRGAFTVQDFLNPSSVLDAGFKTAGPVYGLLRNMSGVAMLWDWPVFAGYLLSYWLIVAAFACIALHAVMTILEMKLAIATGAVLVPWGILTQTAVLGELSLSWMAAGFVRVMLTAFIMAVGVPLFQTLAFPGGDPAVGGVDPTLYRAAVTAACAGLFAAFAWVIPNRTAGLAGRGMALALGADSVVAAGLSGYGYGRAAMSAGARSLGGAVRGTSQLLQQSRRAA